MQSERIAGISQKSETLIRHNALLASFTGHIDCQNKQIFPTNLIDRLIPFFPVAGVAQQATRIPLIQLKPGRCCFYSLFYFLDVFGRRNLLWQITADALDRIANFFANLLVGTYRLLVILDSLARQLVAGLRHAELVGGQLGGIHAVQQVFFVWNAFAGLNGIAS